MDSAIHETKTPSGKPNNKPLPVEIKIEGKKPTALTRISKKKLTKSAQAPKERKKSISSSTLPLVVSFKIFGKKSG